MSDYLTDWKGNPEHCAAIGCHMTPTRTQHGRAYCDDHFHKPDWACILLGCNSPQKPGEQLCEAHLRLCQHMYRQPPSTE